LQFMRNYVPGFESAELSQIAPALGVRETRHFVGDYRLTFEDVDTKAAEHDAVALSGYNIDIHSGTGDGIELEVVDEAFGIPYGCLVPQGVDGLLLSGRTISVDSRVFASARVMGTCMAIGEAAGTAAALALRHNTSVREVGQRAVARLRARSQARMNRDETPRHRPVPIAGPPQRPPVRESPGLHADGARELPTRLCLCRPPRTVGYRDRCTPHPRWCPCLLPRRDRRCDVRRHGRYRRYDLGGTLSPPATPRQSARLLCRRGASDAPLLGLSADLPCVRFGALHRAEGASGRTGHGCSALEWFR